MLHLMMVLFWQCIHNYIMGESMKTWSSFKISFLASCMKNRFIYLFIFYYPPICGTVQVFGLMTKPLVRILLPPSKQITSMISSEPSSPKSVIVPLLSNGHESEADKGSQHVTRPTSLRMLLSIPSHTVHHYWRKFDDSFMRPVFGGRGFVPFVPGSPTEDVVQWHW